MGENEKRLVTEIIDAVEAGYVVTFGPTDGDALIVVVTSPDGERFSEYQVSKPLRYFNPDATLAITVSMLRATVAGGLASARRNDDG